MATFVGSSQGGILGSLLATLGVVLPSFIIILMIASVFTHLVKYNAAKAILSGIRPAVIALILGTTLTMFVSLVLGIKNINSSFNFDFKAFLVLTVISLLSFGYFKWKKKTVSPILLILISGALGILLYSA